MRPGVVHVRDLSHRYMWHARDIAPFLAAAKLEIAPRPFRRQFVAPRVLVLIAAFDDYRLVERSRPWLASATKVVLVRDLRDRAPDLDPELRVMIEDEWRAVERSIPHAGTFDWIDDGACTEALRHAVQLARPLEDIAPETLRSPDLVLPPSDWIAWSAPQYQSAAAVFPAHLAMREGRAVLLDALGNAVDLASPHGPVALDLFGAVNPRMLPVDSWPRSLPVGVDPVHPIGWRGHRMAVYWSYAGGFLSATDHDYPCGPAKKLWGYDDNHPLSVALTASADACAQTFEHDVTFMSAPPIGWHSAGEVEVAAFMRDPHRAAFYAQSAEFFDRATPDLLDEDNRELAPVMVLGPSVDVRYAISLRHRVVRIRGTDDDASAEIIGGPDEGFAVYDIEHRLVRRATGTLLGGWFRHATIEHENRLFREDLATGERTPIDTKTTDPSSIVVAIPGTRNVIEITGDRFRVI